MIDKDDIDHDQDFEDKYRYDLYDEDYDRMLDNELDQQYREESYDAEWQDEWRRNYINSLSWKGKIRFYTIGRLKEYLDTYCARYVGRIHVKKEKETFWGRLKFKIASKIEFKIRNW